MRAGRPLTHRTIGRPSSRRGAGALTKDEAVDVKRMLRLTGFGHRGSVDPARILRQDALLAGVLLIADVTVALTVDTDGRRPDALGWALLIAAHVAVVWRRRAPLAAFLALVACVGPYHALDFDHE